MAHIMLFYWNISWKHSPL